MSSANKYKDMLWEEIGDGVVIFDIRQGLPTDNEIQYCVVMEDNYFVIYEDGVMQGKVLINDDCYMNLFKRLGITARENSK